MSLKLRGNKNKKDSRKVSFSGSLNGADKSKDNKNTSSETDKLISDKNKEIKPDTITNAAQTSGVSATEEKTKQSKPSFFDRFKHKTAKSFHKLSKQFQSSKITLPVLLPFTPTTLIEKATLYRSTYPDKWKARQEELEYERQVSLGNVAESEFMKEYHAEFDKIKEWKKSEAEKELRSLTSICMTVKYLPAKSKEHEYGTYKSLAPKHVTIYHKKDDRLDKLHILPSDMHIGEERGDLPELEITIGEAKHLKEEEDKKFQIKAYLYPDYAEKKKSLKTHHKHASWKMTCNFHHVFIFKGFTQEEISDRFIEFRLLGRYNDCKQDLGSCYLSGAKAFITSNESNREPTQSEKEVFEVAFDRPNNGIEIEREFVSVYDQ